MQVAHFRVSRDFESETMKHSFSIRRAAFALRRMASGNEGVSVVEFAIVLPFLALLFTGIIQVGGIFYVHHNMTTVAQETVRLIAMGEISTDDANTFAQGRLTAWNVTFTVNAQESGDDATVTISAPLSEAALVDILGWFSSGNMSTQATMQVIS